MELQVVSSVRFFLVVVAARPMLRAAVIRLRPKREFNCRLVLAFIFKFTNRNIGIKAVAMSHTHARARQC